MRLAGLSACLHARRTEGRVAANAAAPVIDCLRPPEQHFSEVEVDALSFDAAAALAGGACLLLNVTIVDSVPPRADNKIKLMSFVLF